MKILDLKEVAKTAPTREAMRAALTEAYADLSAATDDELRTLRGIMVGKHSELIAEFQDLGDKRYCSPDGTECMRDMNYYSNCIGRIESEMTYRMLTLD